MAGAPPLGQGQEDQVHRREGHRDLLDSGLSQFLGRRLEVKHRDGRLRSLNNPEPMTDLGPELGNATMRGDQIWVETLGPRAEAQARVHNSRNREQQDPPNPAGPSVQPGVNNGPIANGVARQQSQSARSRSSQGQAMQEQRVHALVSAQHTMYAT